ncbi:hypothetical protein WH50_03360 [Pokkaliibacter plantistimulans]|uniref:Uncharacterized protein n=1 Tax=Pokkaliibacter plantistimulans TaxID=1635171 RepID=A0ABX5M175_9GAMM|nr:hypothetical protein [Pokkaliibacter plantistimulans]PXF32632.1 hypothetical protein WH50_03360 [Pokkaliibacter plantistimulans]
MYSTCITLAGQQFARKYFPAEAVRPFRVLISSYAIDHVSHCHDQSSQALAAVPRLLHSLFMAMKSNPSARQLTFTVFDRQQPPVQLVATCHDLAQPSVMINVANENLSSMLDI